MNERTDLPLSHMTGIEQRLLARARARELGPGDRVVAGFSGGGDSLALACALARLAERGLGPAAMLVHIDHGLREESGRDAAAAGDLARVLGLPFQSCRIDREALLRHPGVGTEEAARRERYRNLAEACLAEGAAAVALAHHRDDQAESVLLHLLRGAGTAGAAGMAEWSHRSVPWWPGEAAGPEIILWRPFLPEPRSALRDFVASLGLAPVDDPSNDDRGFARNRVRLDVIPALEGAFPGATAALARHADLAAEDDSLLDALALALLERATGPDGALRHDALADAPVALRRRAARRWLLDAAPEAEPGMDRVEALLAALERNRGGAVIEIGGGARAIVERGAARMMGTREGTENP